MSYTIEYNGLVLSEKPVDDPDPTLYMFVFQGDNNVYDNSGSRAKGWSLETVGREYSIISRVCERAGSTSGGSLQIQNGSGEPHWITPEEYLAMWRKKVAEAQFFGQLLTILPMSRAWLILEKKEKLVPIIESSKYYFDKLHEVRKIFRPDGTWYDRERVTMNVEHPDDFKQWHEYTKYPFVYMRGFG